VGEGDSGGHEGLTEVEGGGGRERGEKTLEKWGKEEGGEGREWEVVEEEEDEKKEEEDV
jgi:hypothetical protein